MPAELVARPTATTLLRRQETRRNEDIVLAESSLLGERRVAWVRLATHILFGASQAFNPHAIDGNGRPPLLRIAGIVPYLIFSVVTLWALHYRVKVGDPKKALWIPFVFMTVDFGYEVYMGLLTAAQGHTLSEMTVVAMAIPLCFSVARYSWTHVVASTVLACAGFTIVSAAGHTLSSTSAPFVYGGFLALGLLMLMTNLSHRRAFHGLRSRDNLTRFLPRQIVDRLIEHGEAALKPVQCEVTVLFSDIRDFTTFSESLPPRELLEFLDDYLGHMAQIVKGHDGLVNKFLGDGMLAFWGVPDRTPAHAELALKAALDMRKKLVELNEARAAAGEKPVRIGIGVHTGTVAAGMLGGADQHEYTVIGDAVNVASRIEGLTKSLGADILVSESTWRLCGARFAGARVAEERVKGRGEPVVVYSLDEVSGASATA